MTTIVAACAGLYLLAHASSNPDVSVEGWGCSQGAKPGLSRSPAGASLWGFTQQCLSWKPVLGQWHVSQHLLDTSLRKPHGSLLRTKLGLQGMLVRVLPGICKLQGLREPQEMKGSLWRVVVLDKQ